MSTLATRDASAFTKVLAIGGAVLVWLPLAAPVVFAVLSLLRGGGLRFDYLMPAELFLVALIGGGLLLWAAVRAQRRQGLIGWSLALMVVFLVSVQALAQVTGLASGAAAANGWRLALVMAGLAGYIAALVVLGTGGILLARDVIRPTRPR